MKIVFNITKTYTLDKSVQEVFTQQDKIISESYNNVNYTLYGSFINVDPPEFEFFLKSFSMGKPLYPELVSTKIITTISTTGTQTQLTLQTQSSPLVVPLAILITILGIVNLLIKGSHTFRYRMGILGLYVVISILIFAYDRFIKNMLFAAFEKDCINNLTLNFKN